MTLPSTQCSDFLQRHAPIVTEIYGAILSRLAAIGDVREDPKKTSIHLVPASGGSAFAGIHPRKSGILLTIRTSTRVAKPGGRIKKVEQASTHRFHTDILLSSVDEVDDEITAWLEAAYTLASSIRGA